MLSLETLLHDTRATIIREFQSVLAKHLVMSAAPITRVSYHLDTASDYDGEIEVVLGEGRVHVPLCDLVHKAALRLVAEYLDILDVEPCLMSMHWDLLVVQSMTDAPKVVVRYRAYVHEEHSYAKRFREKHGLALPKVPENDCSDHPDRPD